LRFRSSGEPARVKAVLTGEGFDAESEKKFLISFPCPADPADQGRQQRQENTLAP
jgi:hypothetical protein